MPDRRHQSRALAMLVLVMLFWAGNSIVGRAVRLDIPPATLALFRWAGALALVTPFAVAAVLRDWQLIRRHWLTILLLGLLGVAAFNALLYQGLRYTTATNALLLQAAVPAMVVLADRVIFGTRAHRLQLVGVLISTLGVIVVVLRGDPSGVLKLHFGPGDLLVLAAVTVWACYTVLLRLRPPIAPVSFIFTTFAVGVAVMAPLSAWEAATGPWVRWTPMAWGAIGYVALLPSLAAFFMYNSATATLGPARAGQAITMMPLFGALLSALLLGERLQSYHFVGMAFILAGIAVSTLALRTKTTLAPGVQPR